MRIQGLTNLQIKIIIEWLRLWTGKLQPKLKDKADDKGNRVDIIWNGKENLVP